MDSPARLKGQDYKTLSLAALDSALEFYEFIIFVFFAAVISELFFPPDIPDWLRQLQTFAIFAAGYLARPLGRLIMVHFGDKVGRKKMFSLSILLMALPMLAMGLCRPMRRRAAARCRALGCSWRSTYRKSASVSPAAR